MPRAGGLVFALTFFLVSPAIAVDEPRVQAYILGASGGSAAADTFQLSYTVGTWFAGTQMGAETGDGILPGLWGGSPAKQSANDTSITVVGNGQRAAVLKVPPNALSMDFTVHASTNPLTTPLHVSPPVLQKALDNLNKQRSGYTRPVAGQIWEIVVMRADGSRHETLLPVSAVLTLPYPDENNDGIVDGSRPPMRADSLSVWWLDEAHALWVKLPGSTVNKSDKTVSVPVRHFSVFAIMGAPSQALAEAFAFPVPWRPHGPQAGAGPEQSGTPAGGITFSNLPSLGKIRVYTLSGRLVKEIHHDNGLPQETWDVKNDTGDDVATGTYIYVVESDGSRKTGKLVVVR